MGVPVNDTSGIDLNNLGGLISALKRVIAAASHDHTDRGGADDLMQPPRGGTESATRFPRRAPEGEALRRYNDVLKHPVIERLGPSNIIPVGGSAPKTVEEAAKYAETALYNVRSMLRAACSVGRLAIGAARQTCFMIDGLYVVTTRHDFALKSLGDVRIEFPEWSQAGELLRWHECVVRDLDPDSEESFEGYFKNDDEDWLCLPIRPQAGSHLPPPLDVSRDGAMEGLDVLLIDFPNGQQQRVSSKPAKVTRVFPLGPQGDAADPKERGQFFHMQTVSGGSSGAPIFNGQWGVVGYQRATGPVVEGHYKHLVGMQVSLALGQGTSETGADTQISPGDIYMLQPGDPEPTFQLPPDSDHGRMFVYLGDERWMMNSAGANPFYPISPGTPESKRYVRFWFRQQESLEYGNSEQSWGAQKTFLTSINNPTYVPLQVSKFVTGTAWQNAPGDHYKLLQGERTNGTPANMKHVGYVVWFNTTINGKPAMKQHWLLFLDDDPSQQWSKYQSVSKGNHNSKGTLQFIYLPSGIPANLPSYNYTTALPFSNDPYPTGT